MFKNLFGGAGVSTAPAPDRARPSGTDATLNAITLQKKTAEDLSKQIEFLEKKATNERELAKECLRQKIDVKRGKVKAQQHMMNKKKYEVKITNLQAQVNNLLGVADHLETAKAHHQTAKAMLEAKNALKKANEEMPVEKLDDVVADLQEEMQKSAEAQDILAQPILGGMEDVDVDEDMADLVAELEVEDEEEEEAPKLKQKKAAALPTVPQHKPQMKKAEEDEDEDLRALEAEMAS